MINEIKHFRKYPYRMRMLILTNVVYTVVLPIIEMFIGAYIMRNSDDPVMVVVYQIALYIGIPITFTINGYLLRVFKIANLYSVGMMLSGVSMFIMTSLGHLDMYGVGIAGFIMGMSFGFYWANRDFLALESTNDSNRNFYYGFEQFYTTTYFVIIPFLVGWFIQLCGDPNFMGISSNAAYRLIAVIIIGITVIASIICHLPKFENPKEKKFLYFKFHPFWQKMLKLAFLKGLAQGFIVTAPSILVLRFLGQEGALGSAFSLGGIISAVVMYIIGRTTKPSHRIYVFGMGLIAFFTATMFNAVLFSDIGVILFMGSLLIARPLLDVAYFPIQLKVIDMMAQKEKRNEFSYILNHEFGLLGGRMFGLLTFVVLASYISELFALRYALLIIGALQLLSIIFALKIVKTKTLL